jgi:hypothetical protein
MCSGGRFSAQTRPQRSRGGAGSPLAPDPNPERSEGKGSALKITGLKNDKILSSFNPVNPDPNHLYGQKTPNCSSNLKIPDWFEYLSCGRE